MIEGTLFCIRTGWLVTKTFASVSLLPFRGTQWGIPGSIRSKRFYVVAHLKGLATQYLPTPHWKLTQTNGKWKPLQTDSCYFVTATCKHIQPHMYNDAYDMYPFLFAERPFSEKDVWKCDRHPFSAKPLSTAFVGRRPPVCPWFLLPPDSFLPFPTTEKALPHPCLTVESVANTHTPLEGLHVDVSVWRLPVKSVHSQVQRSVSRQRDALLPGNSVTKNVFSHRRFIVSSFVPVMFRAVFLSARFRFLLFPFTRCL